MRVRTVSTTRLVRIGDLGARRRNVLIPRRRRRPCRHATRNLLPCVGCNLIFYHRRWRYVIRESIVDLQFATTLWEQVRLTSWRNSRIARLQSYAQILELRRLQNLRLSRCSDLVSPDSVSRGASASSKSIHAATQTQGSSAYGPTLDSNDRALRYMWLPPSSDWYVCSSDRRRSQSATQHHYVAERFFGRSSNRRGAKPEGVFLSCPWGAEIPLRIQ
jgi:hypothetical protein